MKKLLFALSLGIATMTNAQTNQNLHEAYDSYFQNTREIPHLHLNKTTFFNGEELWFKAYVLEQNSEKLHPTSTNLYVSLFDSTGKLQRQQLVALKNGMGQGSIALDSTLTADKYYLKASTNWMRNFGDDTSYSQEITLINSSEKSSTALAKDQNDYYEFKLLPEGGQLVANIQNNVGILLKDQNNMGVAIEEGFIKNAAGKIIKEFNTNEFGLGSTVIAIERDEKLYFEAHLKNGIILKEELVAPQPLGIGIRVVNSHKDNINITVKTNDASLPLLDKKTYTILIHNTRAYRSQPFTFNLKNKQYTLLVPKNQLPNGVSIITVFDEENRPLLERSIFNYRSQISHELILKSEIHSDSIALSIQNPLNEKVHFSTSILPLKTKAYNPTNSIITNFLLRPYLRGNLQQAADYLKNPDHQKLKNLDLLMLTQGWSKYRWHQIFNNPPTSNFHFENGIDIRGFFNTSIPDNSLLLVYSDDGKVMTQTTVVNNQFLLPMTFVTKHSQMSFAIKTKKGFKPVTPVLQFGKSSLANDQLTNIPQQKRYKLAYQLPDMERTFKATEILDEVTVTKKVKSKHQPAYTSPGLLTRKKTDQLSKSSGETVLNYLNYQGYRTTYNNEENIVLQARAGNRGTLQNSSFSNSTNFGAGNQLTHRRNSVASDDVIASPDLASENTNSYQVRIFLDNIEITENSWMLESIYLDEIDEIFYGRVYELRSLEHIYLYRKPLNQLRKIHRRNASITIDKGFEKIKEYYSPEFNSYTSPEFQHFGAIYWQPETHISAKGSQQLHFDGKLQQEFLIFIEGISESGQLFSQKLHIAPKKNF